MSNYKGHLVGGLCAYLLTIYAVFSLGHDIHGIQSLKWLLLTLAGALFPDVDVKSRGQNYFYWIIFILLLFLLYMNNIRLMAFVGMIAIIPQLSRHRGIFHATWFIITMPVVIAALVWVHLPIARSMLVLDTLFFIVGALSHLWLDRGLRGMLRN